MVPNRATHHMYSLIYKNSNMNLLLYPCISLCQIPKFPLIYWCGDFPEIHKFRKVSDDLLEILWNCAFPKSFYTRILGEILVFYVVFPLFFISTGQQNTRNGVLFPGKLHVSVCEFSKKRVPPQAFCRKFCENFQISYFQKQPPIDGKSALMFWKYAANLQENTHAEV